MQRRCIKGGAVSVLWMTVLWMFCELPYADAVCVCV